IASCAAKDAAAEARPQPPPLLVARHASVLRNRRSPRKDPKPTPSKTSWGCQSRAATILTLLVGKIWPPVGLGTGRTNPVEAKITINPAATTRRECEDPHVSIIRYAEAIASLNTWPRRRI